MEKQYSPSGKFNLISTVVFSIIGLLISMALTQVAALVGMWLFRPYAGMVLMFLSCWVISKLQKEIFKITKNRSVKAARGILIVSGIITAFIHLAAVVSVVIVMGLNIKEISLKISLTNLKDIFVGSLALFRWPATVFSSFVGLGVPWIIYLILTIVCNIFIPMSALAQPKQPFNEDINEWMHKEYSIGRLQLFANEEKEIVTRALLREDIAPILDRPRVSGQALDSYSVVTFYKVRKAHSGFVGIENYEMEHNAKRGGVSGKFKVVEFIAPIQIGNSLGDRLEKMLNSATIVGASAVEYTQNHDSGWSPYRTAADNYRSSVPQPKNYSGSGYARATRTTRESNPNNENHFQPEYHQERFVQERPKERYPSQEETNQFSVYGNEGPPSLEDFE